MVGHRSSKPACVKQYGSSILPGRSEQKRNMKSKFRSIFISDIHLGSGACQAKVLNDFLEHNESENLYLVGDIIDGWKVERNRFRWTKEQSLFVKNIFKKSTKGVSVYYIVGNHDEFLRPMLVYDIRLDTIKLSNWVQHIGVDGQRYLVIHGDMFDGIGKLGRWLSFFGDRAYDLILWLNSLCNRARTKLGFKPWSFSKYLKFKVKRMIDIIFQFEQNVAEYANRRGFDGVICGHIHHPEIRDIVIDSNSQQIKYMNTGDWVENCTALVEHHSGEFEIVRWNLQKH